MILNVCICIYIKHQDLQTPFLMDLLQVTGTINGILGGEAGPQKETIKF